MILFTSPFCLFVYINKRKTSWVCFVNDFYGIEVIWGSIKVVHIHQPSKLSQMEITACVVMLTAHITLNITQYYPRLSNITPNITPILLTLHFFWHLDPTLHCTDAPRRHSWKCAQYNILFILCMSPCISSVNSLYIPCMYVNDDFSCRLSPRLFSKAVKSPVLG